MKLGCLLLWIIRCTVYGAFLQKFDRGRVFDNDGHNLVKFYRTMLQHNVCHGIGPLAGGASADRVGLDGHDADVTYEAH